MIPRLSAFVSSVQGIIILALAFALVVQTVRIEGFKIWPLSIAGLKQQATDAKAERDGYKRDLDDLAAKSKAATERAEKARQEAKRAGDKLRGQATVIERPAPLSGRCETPREIMGAEL